MERYEPFLSLGVAAAAGLLVGFEREQSASPEEKAHQFLGGARTYPLVGLIAAVSTLLLPVAGGWLVALAFAALAALVALSYADDVRAGRDRGLTSEVALLLTFLLGALAAAPLPGIDPGDRPIVVLAAAVAVTFLLSVKPKLHAFVERASKDDVYATLKFLIVAVIVLPLLPDEAMGPLGAFNPFRIGLMVVLIAGIGFVGYVAIRILGPGRGLGLTGLVGGLVSSTAVTLSFAGKARTTPALATSCALAVVLASTIMFPRVLVEVAIVHWPLLPPLVAPMGLATVGGAAASWVLYRRGKGARTRADDVKLENPFELSSAVKWGLLFAAVLFLSQAANRFLGAGGIYLAGLVAGATDVDAITLSMASLASRGEVRPEVAVRTIVIGAASNTLVKAALAVGIGGSPLARQALPAFLAALAAGAVGFLAVVAT